MSANEFISMEELRKRYIKSTEPKDQKEKELISLEDALKCLTDTITEAREQGKTTRLHVVDLMMRTNEKYNYMGCKSVKRKENENFKSFKEFITVAQSKGVIKIDTIEGFEEIYLQKEDPNVESEFSSIEIADISKEDWTKIMECIESYFKENDPEFYLYGRFTVIREYIRKNRRDYGLSYTHKSLRAALSKIVEIGYLVLQEDSSYRLVENHKKLRQGFVAKIILQKTSI